MTLIAVMSFTSCLEGENKSSGVYVGILDYNRGMTPVIKTLSGYFYGPELNSYITSGKMNIGEGWLVQITYEEGLPENSLEMLEINGYYTASVVPYVQADKYYAAPYLTDTSEVMTSELPVSDALYSDGAFGIAEGYLFITHVINHEKGGKLKWDMSYDSDNMVTEENGLRYYNLYVRAVKSGSDDDENTSTTDQAYFNMYLLRDFFDRAARDAKDKAGINASFTVKFNYVSEIKESEIIWKSKATDLPISLFVSE
jgi:hypothetical protein